MSAEALSRVREEHEEEMEQLRRSMNLQIEKLKAVRFRSRLWLVCWREEDSGRSHIASLRAYTMACRKSSNKRKNC